jgi:hypothetical protein
MDRLMMRRVARWVAIPTLAIASLSAGGCLLAAVGAGAAAGIGVYAYTQGKLENSEEVTLDRGWDATQRAMDDLQFTVVSRKKDATMAELIAETADGKKVTVNLKPDGERITRFSIRVGTFGDESVSRMIMDKIKQRL